MNILFAALLVIFVIYFIYELLLVVLKGKIVKDVEQPHDLPFVSVLVAARNEEKNIERCMQALSELDYPADRIEFLIGDDASTDLTSLFVKAFEQKDNRFALVRVKENLGNARGKANALAHLAKKAKGDFFFITDADIKVPKTWIKGLLKKFHSNTGIVSGTTAIEGNTLFARLQNIEWLYAFGMVNLVSSYGIKVSAVGNNMAIRREAYEQTGGYEKIPFSVTEDYALYIEVLKHNWKCINFASPEIMGSSIEQPDFFSLLKQRRRWMSGAVHMPVILFAFLGLQALFFPLWVLMLFTCWQVALAILGLKIILEALFVQQQWKRCGRTDQWLHLFPLYQLYTMLFAVVLSVYYFITPKVQWKGRTFDGK